MGEHVAAVGDLEREVHVLLDEQHGAAALLRELPHDRQQPLDDHGRQPEAQLVEQQQLRAARERPRDGEHLLLAAGQQARAPALQVAEVREVLVRDRLVEVLARWPEAEVLRDRQAEEEPAPLGHVRDPEPARGRSASCARGRARRARCGPPSA